jgi:hypothetical protein
MELDDPEVIKKYYSDSDAKPQEGLYFDFHSLKGMVFKPVKKDETFSYEEDEFRTKIVNVKIDKESLQQMKPSPGKKKQLDAAKKKLMTGNKRGHKDQSGKPVFKG